MRGDIIGTAIILWVRLGQQNPNTVCRAMCKWTSLRLPCHGGEARDILASDVPLAGEMPKSIESTQNIKNDRNSTNKNTNNNNSKYE